MSKQATWWFKARMPVAASLLALTSLAAAVVLCTRSPRLNVVERYAQCVYRPKGRTIDSININIVTNNKKLEHEMPLFKFRELVNTQVSILNTASDVLQELLDRLNALPSVVALQVKSNKFEVIYRIGDEAVLYRWPKAYGFHVKVSVRNTSTNEPEPKPQPSSDKGERHVVVDVLGVINHYDIESQYKQQLSEDYHSIDRIILPNDLTITSPLSIDFFNKKMMELMDERNTAF